MVWRSLFAIFAILGLNVPALAKGPLRTVSVGNWSGGSFTNDRTGDFSHCAASATYRHGTNLHVAVNYDYSWTLGFSNTGWNMPDGNDVTINLWFDGAGPIAVKGKVNGKSLIVVPMPDNSALIRAFREGSQMQSVIGGVRVNFALTTTSRLIPELANCVRWYKEPVEARRDTTPPLPKNDEVDKERTRLINEAADEHQACMRKVMRDIVPYSSENADTLAQVIITRCQTEEKKFVSLGVALYGASKADVERIVTTRVEQQKREMVADIVTFRAELNKALLSQPKPDNRGESGI
jgi:hypothetical protein